MSNENCRALLESVHEELTNMGFNADDSIDGGDFVEYGGKLYVDIGEAIERDMEATPPTMAERWVRLQEQHEDWYKEKPGNNLDFDEWLDQDRPEERETLTWIASWDARSVDARLKADRPCGY